MQKLLLVISFALYQVSGISQESEKCIRHVGISTGLIFHTVKTSSLNNKTKGLTSNSLLLNFFYQSFLGKKKAHIIYVGSNLTRYKFRYEASYPSNTYSNASLISSDVGSNSTHSKTYISYGYNLNINSRFNAIFAVGPSLYFNFRKGLYGRSKTEIIDSIGSTSNVVIIKDSILIDKKIASGFVANINLQYKLFQKKDIFLVFSLFTNFGFTPFNSIHTTTLYNGSVYDKAIIRGKGDGLNINIGLLLPICIK